MPRIRSHHLPGHPLADRDPYTPSDDWPDTVTVQWGGDGIVLGQDSYRTAFFEAFPDEGGFIRGEGKTIADAEADALKKWHRESACDHVWGRAHYLNGAALCKRCKGFKGSVFAPVLKLGSWREPLNLMDLDPIISGWLRETPTMRSKEHRKHIRQRFLRARLAGIGLPETPPEPMSDDQFLGVVLDPYRAACREAVASWLETGKHGLSDADLERVQRSIDMGRKHDHNLAQKAQS